MSFIHLVIPYNRANNALLLRYLVVGFFSLHLSKEQLSCFVLYQNKHDSLVHYLCEVHTETYMRQHINHL